MKVEKTGSDENKNICQVQLNNMLMEFAQKHEDELFFQIHLSNNTSQLNINNNLQLNSEVYYSATSTITNDTNDKYAVMELARKDVPMAVYVCGRMVTLGILGTDVECAFTGDKLVFAPNVITAAYFGRKITLSIEYDDEIQHHNIGKNGQITYINEQSSTLEVTLVSTIMKKKGSYLSGMQ